MSLSSSLSIVLRGIQADQEGLNVTSNNIANVNTPGYSREVANFDETPPISFGNLDFGTGVTLANIQGIRDNVLQLRLNQETQNQGSLGALSTGLNQIQTLFNEPAGSGLQSLISQFFGSFQAVATDPTNLGNRQAVIGDAQSLADGFNQTANALVTQEQNANQAVVGDVEQINQLTSQIANLNEQISAASGGGQNPNSLIDQRAQLITQLSGAIDVESITADGSSLSLTTNNGTLLVVGNQSFKLQTQTVAGGNQDVFAQGKDITSAIQGGDLAGQIQLRDQTIPGFLNTLDTLANSIATSVNSQQAAGFDLNGNAGAAIFVPPGAVAGSALNLAVSITDPSQIAASADGTPGNNANATALANLQNQNIVSGQTPIDFYSGLVFNVGNAAQTASSQLSGENLVVQQINDQINSVSGVSLDEEGANLVLYQNAFAASERVASVIAGLIQTTINMVPTTTA
jgi:flagellar hook-associated protein 1